MSASNPNTESLFAAALAMESPEERANYLDQACGTDQQLKAQVEELLAAYPKVERFLESPARDPVATVDGPAVSERPGTVIGPYKLLQQIGEGGMGTVFMAEQTQPVQRKVALKVIKPGMDSRQVVARFEAERQALAMMDHVNIARVFDGGATEAGRPYFVMELVHGVPITKYCDDNHLTPRERLELFVPVCQAIQHAHQKGIIHRDIKPSNVMVTLYDGKPVPKVIDFGVAKATEQTLTERTLFTQYSTMVGTLEYMSPEQAEMSALGVDTRSDIYSLGVLLYELLTGSTPLTHKRMKEAAYAEILRMIKEEEPPKPSTRLSDSGEALATISAQRHMEPAKLTKLVRGELDWIVMKTLEKDRNRRYETANAFADDVRRYLNDETVLACPPSAMYRFRKFARRRKVALTIAALIAVFLIVGAGALTMGYFRIEEEQRRTQEALLAEAGQRQRAEANFQKALAAVDEMLTQVGQDRLAPEPHLEEVRRALLEKALAFYQAFLQEKSADPAIRVETGMAFRRVGAIQHLLGRHDQAKEAYDQGIALLEALTGELPRVAPYRYELARCYWSRGSLLKDTGPLGEAEQELRKAQALQETSVAEAPDRGDCRQDLARSHNALGIVLENTNQHKEAEQSYRQAVELNEKLVTDFPALAVYHKEQAKPLINLANLLRHSGQFPEAERAYRQAVAAANKAVEKFPGEPDFRAMLAYAHASLGTVLIDKGQFPEAERALRDALDLLKKLGSDFPARPEYRRQLAHSYNSLAILLWRAGRSEDGDGLYGEAVKILEKLAADLPRAAGYQSELGATLNNWATLLRERGQLERARQKLEQAVRHQKAAWAANPRHPHYGNFLSNHYSNLANILEDLKAPSTQTDDAAEQAITIMKKLSADFPAVSEYHSGAGGSLHNFALVLQKRGQLKQARPLLEEAIRYQQVALKVNPRSPTYRQFLGNHYHNLAEVLSRLKAPPAQTENVYRQALIPRTELAAEFPKNAGFQRDLAATRQGLETLLGKQGPLPEVWPP
jgi:eukaryotic-like serine/threonine-protein kinase